MNREPVVKARVNATGCLLGAAPLNPGSQIMVKTIHKKGGS